MDIEEAQERIQRMLNDPYGSGGINAVKRLFDSLMQCSMGFDPTQDKSGPFGMLDEENREALGLVLSDRAATIKLCHHIYYGEVEA